MDEKIKELRENGLTYKKISEKLNCSISTVHYHLNETAKQKQRKRHREYINKILCSKIHHFKTKNEATLRLRSKTHAFGRDKYHRGSTNVSFGYHDVIDKFSIETICYITGKKINLLIDDYHFDHIIPPNKGGDNSLENLGILCKEANLAKGEMLVDEFIQLCKNILEYNGYIVNKI